MSIAIIIMECVIKYNHHYDYRHHRYIVIIVMTFSVSTEFICVSVAEHVAGRFICGKVVRSSLACKRFNMQKFMSW